MTFKWHLKSHLKSEFRKTLERFRFKNESFRRETGCGHINPPDREIRQTPSLGDVSSSYFPEVFLVLRAHLLPLIGHSLAATATQY